MNLRRQGDALSTVARALSVLIASERGSILLLEHDLFRKTGIHFCGCSSSQCLSLFPSDSAFQSAIPTSTNSLHEQAEHLRKWTSRPDDVSLSRSCTAPHTRGSAVGGRPSCTTRAGPSAAPVYCRWLKMPFQTIFQHRPNARRAHCRRPRRSMRHRRRDKTATAPLKQTATGRNAVAACLD